MRNNFYEIHNNPPSPTKSSLSTPNHRSPTKDDKDDTIHHLQRTNFDL